MLTFNICKCFETIAYVCVAMRNQSQMQLLEKKLLNKPKAQPDCDSAQ
jgi:hypothetical protein